MISDASRAMILADLCADEGLRLANDEAKAELDVLAHLPWVANLDPARQSVLVEMAFNMGIAGLLEFRNTLDAINEGRWQDASNGLLTSLAAHQEPARVARWAAKLRS